MKYFGRKANISIADVTFDSEEFGMEFEVTFDHDTDPNESQITLFNLNSTSLGEIKKHNQVVINAGYEGDVGQILFGFVSSVSTANEVDRKTNVKVIDKPLIKEDKTINKSFKKNIKASQLIRDLLSKLRIEATINLPKDKVYAKGYEVDGNIDDEIASIAKDCGAIFYINQGKAYIQKIQSSTPPSFLLKPDTGLIGTPSPFEEEVDGKTIQGFNVECLLQHRITTGSVIKIESSTANGVYYVRGGKHRWGREESITELEVIV
ncbi:phage protein [Halobacillus sp. SY10]|uniref:phage protein n=1 Tax=Halobacillus sp. SY10 TaxID=3381356 RepID=UPI0038792848